MAEISQSTQQNNQTNEQRGEALVSDEQQPAILLNPKADIAALAELERHLYAHRYAKTGISSYGPTIDPEAATSDRAEALAILEEEDQTLLCSPETGEMLERLSLPHVAQLLTPTQVAQVKILKRDRTALVDVPSDVQADFTRLCAESDAVWRKAKANNDWDSFAPYLDKIVASMVHIAELRDDTKNPYDLWLDHFEHGTDRAFYDSFFKRVRDVVVPLLAAIQQCGWQADRSIIEGKFDESRQWNLAHELMELEGLDLRRMFLAQTEHPFSDALTSNYGIIASHVYVDDVISNVYSMLHEGGHALYETNVDSSFDRTSLKGGTSMGMHEAQSRFFENYVGHARAFAPHLLSAMARHFRGQLGRVTPNQFYQATNRVEGSLIRTEADELTYPLHILIRYELEQALFAGEIHANDVPELWNAKYKSYLGVDVPDYTHGCLQDTHWADGLFGYFPTYALGGAYGAQFRARMIAEGMDFDGILASADLEPIRTWLRERIWKYGRSKDPQEIIVDACGEAFNPSYYTDYLSKKFSALYGL